MRIASLATLLLASVSLGACATAYKPPEISYDDTPKPAVLQPNTPKPVHIAISGASAGGYTTLAALTFRKEFKTGASYYGVSDLEALAKDTHKFESRYLDGLIGPYPQRRDLYVAPSPIHSARLLAAPVAFFQGAEDRVVPPQQAEEMVDALRRRRIPFLYLLFDGEQHGFRRADNIKRALDAELYFYATFLTDQRLEFRVS